LYPREGEESGCKPLDDHSEGLPRFENVNYYDSRKEGAAAMRVAVSYVGVRAGAGPGLRELGGEEVRGPAEPRPDFENCGMEAWRIWFSRLLSYSMKINIESYWPLVAFWYP